MCVREEHADKGYSHSTSQIQGERKRTWLELHVLLSLSLSYLQKKAVLILQNLIERQQE